MSDNQAGSHPTDDNNWWWSRSLAHELPRRTATAKQRSSEATSPRSQSKPWSDEQQLSFFPLCTLYFYPLNACERYSFFRASDCFCREIVHKRSWSRRSSHCLKDWRVNVKLDSVSSIHFPLAQVFFFSYQGIIMFLIKCTVPSGVFCKTSQYHRNTSKRVRPLSPVN